jgi:hypothetical protein
VSQLQAQRADLRRAVETLDLTAACIGLPHVRIGVMTRMEWVYFTIYHTERHLKQLQRLQESVTS